MSAFDELEHQLADSVAARAGLSRAAAAGSVARRWRGRGAGRAFTLAMPIVCTLVLAAGALVQRTGAGAPNAPLAGALTASAAESSCVPCMAVSGRLHAPLRGEAVAGASPVLRIREVRIRRGRPIVGWGTSGGLGGQAERTPVG